MTTAVQAYSYARPSTLDGSRLGLSTSGGRALSGPQRHPRFFSGLITEAEPAAAGLLALADVAMTRYHQPRPGWTRDPVVTCDGSRLRLESFSACGGVYARLDLAALDGDILDRGTTNVDVNGPLREALARVGGGDPLHLGVGADELAVTTLDGAVMEALDHCARSGAHREVWAILTGLLPIYLPSPGERAHAGHARALRFATDAARWADAHGSLPTLANAAARPTSSAFTTTAHHLHTWLTRP
ncbi:hypothetical protein [Nonomuraea sediminis]|uniref:hypothetical protein n=1 Tax=Nonomuraea sediminis TaxID=2835864 RepID=UPI002029C510|nr:hypothetical protein [Nonomuraea sediminis]